jgi:hypothetical protein
MRLPDELEQALVSFDKFSKETQQLVTQEPSNTKTLYHYTDIGGLVGMLRRSPMP